jgi:hypothetical protein
MAGIVAGSTAKSAGKSGHGLAACDLHSGPVRRDGSGTKVRGYWGREVEFKEPGLYAHIVCLLIR